MIQHRICDHPWQLIAFDDSSPTLSEGSEVNGERELSQIWNFKPTLRGEGFTKRCEKKRLATTCWADPFDAEMHDDIMTSPELPAA